MDHKSRTRIAVLVAVIIVAGVFASFGYSLLSMQTPSVVLPSLQPDSSAGTDHSSSNDPFLRVEVTRDTVQAVIASLSRSGSYYRQLTVDTFWSGGSSSVTVQTWTDGGFSYIRSSLPSGQIRYALTTGDTVYYWYDGSTTWRTAPAGSLSTDLAQRIPTYEDVLALPVDSISDAGYGLRGDQTCIYVETTVDELGYLERYWVSVESGLLIASETLKGDQVIYSMSAYSPIQTPCPTDVVFSLPDGTVLHSF